MKKLSFIILLIALCSVSVYTQTKKFRVDLKTEGFGDAQIENEMRSYLARELRSLGDVEIVDKGDFTVSAAVLKVINKDGVIGYAVSYIFVQNVSCQGQALNHILGSGLYAVEPGGLRKISEPIITSFDTGILEKMRKAK